MKPIDFGELKTDEKFINCVNNFNDSLDKVDASIDAVVNFKNYEELPTEDKVKLDNYMAYSINSLYWMYLKIQGIDPNEHDVKNELSRVRQTILREKQIHDHKTIRPVLDKAAAGRFIKHGLKRPRPNDDDDDETAEMDVEPSTSKSTAESSSTSARQKT